MSLVGGSREGTAGGGGEELGAGGEHRSSVGSVEQRLQVVTFGLQNKPEASSTPVCRVGIRRLEEARQNPH